MDIKNEYHAKVKARAALLAEIKPVQDEYDAARSREIEARQALIPIRDRLLTAKQPLFEIENEIAALARALNHRPGAEN